MEMKAEPTHPPTTSERIISTSTKDLLKSNDTTSIRERRPLDAGEPTSDGPWNSSEIRDRRRLVPPPSYEMQTSLVLSGPEMSTVDFLGGKLLTDRSPPKPNRPPTIIPSLVKPVLLAGESSGSKLTLTPFLPNPTPTSTALINAPFLSNTICCTPSRDPCLVVAADKNGNRRSLEIWDKCRSIKSGWTFPPSGLVHSRVRRTFEFLKLGPNSDGLTWTLLHQVSGCSDPMGLVFVYLSPSAGLDLHVPGPDPLGLLAADPLNPLDLYFPPPSAGGALGPPLICDSTSGPVHSRVRRTSEFFNLGPNSDRLTWTLLLQVSGCSDPIGLHVSSPVPLSLRTVDPLDPLGLYLPPPSLVGAPGPLLICDSALDGPVLPRKPWTLPAPSLAVDQSPAPASIDPVPAPMPGVHAPAPTQSATLAPAPVLDDQLHAPAPADDQFPAPAPVEQVPAPVEQVPAPVEQVPDLTAGNHGDHAPAHFPAPLLDDQDPTHLQAAIGPHLSTPPSASARLSNQVKETL